MVEATTRADGFREVFRNRSQSAPEGAWERFAAALEDDFNTPDALALMHEWRRVRNLALLRRALGLFGLAPAQADAPDEIRELARLRHEAREQRDFVESDRLRAEIEAAGWVARDAADGYRLVPK
jgi:cysteinyl-tRNA synthetase